MDGERDTPTPTLPPYCIFQQFANDIGEAGKATPLLKEISKPSLCCAFPVVITKRPTMNNMTDRFMIAFRDNIDVQVVMDVPTII
jgi:hypothetical protein